MMVAVGVLAALLACAGGVEVAPATVDTVDVADVMGNGWSVIDLDLLEQLYRTAFSHVDTLSLGACFLSAGTDTLGEVADPPPELLKRLADTGVDVRPWSRHEQKGWAEPIRDRETGDLGATWTVRLARHPAPQRLLFSVWVFPRMGDDLHFTLTATRLAETWQVTMYKQGDEQSQSPNIL
jgi:hypothetical protein